MGRLIRSHEWKSTPLGDPVSWPQTLKIALGIVLNSRFPMLLFWGSDMLVFYNDAFIPSFGSDGTQHPALGKKAADVWVDAWPFVGPLLEKVFKTGESVWFEDQPVPIFRNGRVEEVCFTFNYSPVVAEDGSIPAVQVTCFETTGKVEAKKKIEESERNLKLIIHQAHVAIAIFRGPQYIVEIANRHALGLWGRTEAEVLGKPILDVMTELEAQGIKQLLDHVYQTGEPFSATELPIKLLKNGLLETAYINFIYEALHDAGGQTNGLITIGIDVTDAVTTRHQLQDLNDELATSNEELSASNEGINAANEELNRQQKSLQVLNQSLTESENLFRSLVRQAPIGICIIRAGDLRVLMANEAYLELAGKKASEMDNRHIWAAVPEAKDVYGPIMDTVIATATAHEGKEVELVLIRNGLPENVALDFVYEPILDQQGAVFAVLVLAIDVTEKVAARRRIEEMEERVRLAVEAAETGTFDLNLKKQEMLTSPRFNEIFGFERNVSWRSFVSAIHPADQEKRRMAHETAVKNGKLFYEARVVHDDGSVHWVRVQGKAYNDKSGDAERIIGTAIDITQFKQLQQQKDDFLSIASHELKTPITSLKASLQLLDRMKDKPPAGMLERLIAQANKSMQKISALVEDLLSLGRSSDTQMRLNKTQFVVADMLNMCCPDIRAEGKFKLVIQGDIKLRVNADEHAIDQVIVNLVTNAVKYAPDSPLIVLDVSRDGDMAKIGVTDRGPGIAPDKIPHLFERYYQVDASGYSRSGLGLGLYISSEIVKRHNGQIGVESELGKGSTFWIKLPISE